MSDLKDKKIKFKFLQSAQSRIYLAIGLIVLVIAGVSGFLYYRSQVAANIATVAISGTPSIESTPGAGNPSAEYTKAQRLGNIEGERAARKSATSFVPTITRPEFSGNPNVFGENETTAPAATDQNKICQIKRVVLTYKPNPESCLPKNLALARKTGVTAEELMCQGCSCPALKVAGFTAGDLKNIGMTAEQLRKCGFSLEALMRAGFSAADLRQAGYSASQLATAGFSPNELAAAGFTPAELAKAYTKEQLENAGLVGADGRPICSVAEVEALKAEGESAAELRKEGCGLAALKAAGFTAAQLKAAGYSAAELKNAGFTAAELKKAGFSAAELKKAGFSNSDLANAGFTPAEIKAADEAAAASCDVAKLIKDREAGMSAKELKEEGCGLAALKAAGFTAAQLKAAGYSAAELKNAGFDDAALRAAGFTPAEIAAANDASKNCSVAKLEQERKEGISATALKQQGCGLAALKAAGFSAADLRAAGFSAKQLKDAGFSASDLRAAGFSAAQLKNAGFTAAELKKAGYSAAELKNAGFSASALKDAGFSAAQLKAAGFSAAELKKAGFSATQLKDAGFSAKALKDAGFTAGQLVGAGFDAKALKDAGFTANQLRAAGVSATALHDAGFSASALRQAGFTDGDLLRAGFSPDVAGYQAAVPQKTTETQAAQKSPGVATSTAATGNVAIPDIAQDTTQSRLAQLQKQEQAELSQEEKNNRIEQLQGMMMSQAQEFMSGWSNFAQQQMMKAPEEKAGQAAGGAGAEGQASQQGQKQPQGPVIKAGTILFAVLTTGINSDEKSPIMASIVAGKLKGSRLLGTFSRVDKRVLIRFTLMSNPAYDRSISINAVAVDPNTARTAISGEVNNHYLLRYGTLFASSFLEGVSEGIINQGVTTDCSGGGGLFCVVKTSPLNTDQQIAVGLGKVGKAYAQHMGENFNLPPTIRIPAGSGIGILIMSDLTLPVAMNAEMQ